MELFEHKKIENKKQVAQRAPADRSTYIKQNLLKSTTRDGKVFKAIEKWLNSWEGGMTKNLFERQMKRLDRDDDLALAQLANAEGRRVIPLPPPPKKPALTKPLVEQMLADTYVGIYGRKFKPVLKTAVDELKECGETYVLEMEELILQFKSYSEKGTAPHMIDKAILCDFLVVVDLERPIHLEWHIREAIERIGRKREAAKRPMISTWNRFNDCNRFFERFSIYIVE